MEFNRGFYLQKLISASKNDMIKIITGIRRCGKSYLLFEIFRNYLLSQGVQEDHIIGLAMDDNHNKSLRNPDKLLEYIDNHLVQDGQTSYVILDEVQMVDDFVGVLLSMTHKKNVQTYVSGSNSKFLSKDVVTEFRGRGWEIRVYPLSFAEYYEAIGGDKVEALNDYYTYGGLPAVAKMETPEEKETYLRDVYRTIYLKDIIEHNHLHNEEGLEDIFRVLSSSMGTAVNPTKIANTFKSEAKIKISANTIAKYIEYLKDAFLVSEALRYDIKGRKYIGANSKYYFEDPGVRNAILGFRQIEFSHMMENVLYNELCARGYSVDVGLVEIWERDEEGKTVRIKVEVDYVVNRGSQRIYIQSAYMLPDKEKSDQEQRPLINISDNFRKVIISGDFTKGFYNDEGIYRIGVFNFLLDRECLNK
ncbi:MAG: ATP-binding protein [Paludibacteraceae bacterium]|nr:ATP-binding protein [Paludibacteraceae bacterium]MBQ8705001.1 ATP-binding protein [Paludibacteraceae bacterium]